MRILFYFVHPAKYHLFRHSITELKKNHAIDIVINTKSVLQELIEKEGWDYHNLFPKGRNTATNPSVLMSAMKFLLTIFRLEKYLMSKPKYDFFITDDTLVVNGWYRKVFTIIFNDNDIETIRFNRILFYFANKIIAPESVKLGMFTNKKWSFKGNKALAHLHPKYFSPDKEIIHKYGLIEDNYGIIRVSKINATHDLGNKGITNNDLEELITICLESDNIIISAERELPPKYEKYIFRGNPNDFDQIIFFAKYFIGDSATMASESALLGTPNILINKLGKMCSVNRDLLNSELQYYFDDYKDAKLKIGEIIKDTSLKQVFRLRSIDFINKCDDFNLWFLNIVQNHQPDRKFSYIGTLKGKY